MLWLINGRGFKSNFKIYELDGLAQKWNSEHNQTKNLRGKKGFGWNYARRSWSAVRRHVFIDFGENTLFLGALWCGD